MCVMYFHVKPGLFCRIPRTHLHQLGLKQRMNAMKERYIWANFTWFWQAIF